MKMYPLSLEERNEMIHLYSDFHKDAYGYRPRYNYPAFSDQELVADYDRFSRVCDENAKEEAIQLEADLKAWNELVDKTIHLGAGDRETALRWLLEGENNRYYHEQDVEHFVWNQGILFCDEGKALVKELLGLVKWEAEEWC